MVRRAGACATALLVVLATAGPVHAAPAPGRPVDLGGTEVEASTDPGAPTPLTAGLWADTLTGPAGEGSVSHWFSYRRTVQDSSVLVGVAGASADTSGLLAGVEVTVFEPGGDQCGSDPVTARSETVTAVFGALVAVPDDEPGNSEDPCVRAAELRIEVSRGSSSSEADLPVVLRVVEEAPVQTSLEDLPPVPDEPTVPVPTPGEPRPLEGGASFDDAPDLEPGETVSDSVLQGGEHLYRVRLGWGQALSVRVDVPAQDEAASTALDGFTPTVGLLLLDPLRNGFDTGHPDADDSVSYGDEPARLFDGTRPLALANRYDDGVVSVPGDHWVSVRVAPPNPYDADAPLDPVEVPFELTVDVVGEPGEPPAFPGGVLSPGDDPGPEGYAQATPYLLAEGEFSADVSGTPQVTDAGSDGARRTAGLVVGGLSLVSLLAGAVLLLRRRRVVRLS